MAALCGATNRRTVRIGRYESDILLVSGKCREANLWCRTGVYSADGYECSNGSGEVQPWTFGGGIGAAGALDGWCADQQCVLRCGLRESTGCEPDAVAVLHQLQPEEGLLP